MEGLKVFLTDAPQESSPAPGTASPKEDQPIVALPTNEETSGSLHDSELAPTLNKEPSESPQENNKVFIPREASEAKVDDALTQENNESPRSSQDKKHLRISVPSSTPEARLNNSSETSVASTADESNTVKIIARLSPEDDHVPSVSSPQSVNSPLARVAKVAMRSTKSEKFPDQPNTPTTPRIPRTPRTPRARTPRTPIAVGQIDTTPPFESVKAAVSKFGGIVDWKAHRMQTMERRKTIELELEKAQEEIPLFKKQSEEAEEAKQSVVKELDSTKKLIEELKLNLERAQTEEQQAKQDSELAKLRVEELEKGIADDACVAAKAQLEVARARHAAALSDLKTVELELKQLRRDYDMLVAEKDAYAKKAEEALSMSKEIEKTVEDLTIELITAKESLETAHALHLEAEEQKIGAVLAKEQDMLNWEKELKQAEEELEKMSQKVAMSKDLRSKLDSASALLQDLKAGLAAYMELKLDQESGKAGSAEDLLTDTDKETRMQIEAVLSAAKKKLEELKLNIEKTNEEVNILKVAATSLKLELEKEEAELTTIQQREGMATIAVASLEAELDRTKSEIVIIQLREKEHIERMVELPKKLQEAAQEADQAKALSQRAREELRKAKEEAEHVKAGKGTMESRLRAAQKEIEAAKASEKLAVAAINALVESESTQSNSEEDSSAAVTLSLEEYYELSKQAHEAEEQANDRVADALAKIELAKESQLKTLKRLEEANHETAESKNALEAALQKAEKAKEGKLAAEHELRKWRADHEQMRKAGESVSPKSVSGNVTEPKKSHSGMFKSAPVHKVSFSSNTESDTSSEVKVTKKKRRSLIPKLFMFLRKKKRSSRSSL